MNRATAGLPEWAIELSILEDEIRQDRADGSLYEPRVVAQRSKPERFAVVGAICKRIDTPIGAVVARDFREVPLDEALTLFLAPRVPPPDLDESVRRASATVLAAGDRAATVVAPLATGQGVLVHQFGIDGRLCWNPETKSVEFWFLEFQFGIGRIDVPLSGYRTATELRERFGPEVG